MWCAVIYCSSIEKKITIHGDVNDGLAGDQMYGKCLFTKLSLLMSSMVFIFGMSFHPRDVLDEI